MKSVDITSEQSSAYLHNGIFFSSRDGGGQLIVDPNGQLQAFGEVVSQTTYKNELLTNGGLLDLTYTLGLDTTSQIAESWNLETDEILTYASVDGSTLAATERATLDIAANYEATQNNMRCAFAQGNVLTLPAFCNKVTAESTLASVTSMAVQTSLELRDTAATPDTPAALNYKINVDPNTAQGGQYADGQVGVTFTTSVREANGIQMDVVGMRAGLAPGLALPYYQPNWPGDWWTNMWDDEARITTVVDTITVTCGITKLTKEFKYSSRMTV